MALRPPVGSAGEEEQQEALSLAYILARRGENLSPADQLVLQQLRLAIEAIPVAIFIADHEEILVANRLACEFLGVASFEELDTNLPRQSQVMVAWWTDTGERIPPENLPLLQALRGVSITREMTLTYPRTDKQVVMNVTAEPILVNGVVHSAVAVGMDVTAYVRAKEMLHQRERELIAIERNVPYIMARFDRDLRHIYINTTVSRFSGLSTPPFIGRTSQESWADAPPGLMDRWENALRQAFETGETVHFESVVPILNGTLRYLSTQIVPEKNSEGGPPKTLLAVTQDVSEQRETERELAASLARLQAHVQNTPLAVIEWNADGSVRSWSRQAERIFGWTEAEAKAKIPGEWQFVHEDDAEQVRALVVRLHDINLAQDNEADRNDAISRNRSYTRDGRIVYCEWHNSALVDAGGEFVSVLSIVQDVTAQVEAQAAQQEQLEKQQRIADVLQQSLLINPQEANLPGLEVVALYQPALEEANVGGDFYDLFRLNETRSILVVGDVTGKGLEAAASMAETKYALRALIAQADGGGEHPYDALTRLNRFQLQNLEFNPRLLEASSRFVSLILAVFDADTGRVRFAVGGAEPMVLVRVATGRAEEVPNPGGLPVGVQEESVYGQRDIFLQPGDLLAIFTDGLTEARRPAANARVGARYEFLGTGGIVNLLHNSQDTPLQVLVQRIYDAARAFGPINDDVCLVLVRRA